MANVDDCPNCSVRSDVLTYISDDLFGKYNKSLDINHFFAKDKQCPLSTYQFYMKETKQRR